MLWLYDCICMILKATSESEVVENNNHVPEKFTEFDNQRKMEAFFLILIDWTTCWLSTVFFIYNAGHYFRCSLTLLVNTCLLFIGEIKKVAKVILQLGNQGSLCLHEVKLIWFSPSHRKCFLWMHFIWQTLTTKIVFGKNTYFPL